MILVNIFQLLSAYTASLGVLPYSLGPHGSLREHCDFSGRFDFCFTVAGRDQLCVVTALWIISVWCRKDPCSVRHSWNWRGYERCFVIFLDCCVRILSGLAALVIFLTVISPPKGARCGILFCSCCSPPPEGAAVRIAAIFGRAYILFSVLVFQPSVVCFTAGCLF